MTVLLGAAAAWTGQAAAQRENSPPAPGLTGGFASAPITMVTERGLSFGLLIPGRTEVVGIGDVQRRALVWISGAGQVQLGLVLPQQLTTAEGNTLPLSFRPGDAGILYPSSSVPQVFDPRAGVQLNLSQAGGNVGLVVGGSALVAPPQPAGDYTGKIVVVITNPAT